MSYYERIKEIAKKQKCRVTDLIVLAPQNDPFYMGTESDKEKAEWFAELWRRFKYSDGVHLRRVHYQVISQKPPVKLPNGKPYENTQECWEFLVQAGKCARYLDLVAASSFVDRRAPPPKIFLSDVITKPAIGVLDELSGEQPELPPFPDLPCFTLAGFERAQPYHLEIWCEKSTQNDVFLPLCEEYGINFVTGLGELSLTATLAVVERVATSKKPARIFYVSDFDPAGKCMPVSVARKIEYWVRNENREFDIRLFPVVLTQEQVEAYELPRTPIKEKERRREVFESRYGMGAVELDALEALHPGELERLMRELIENYYDSSLSKRVEKAKARWSRSLSKVQRAVYGRHEEELDQLRAEYEALRTDFTSRMASCNERMTLLWEAIAAELEADKPLLVPANVPSPEEGQEIDAGLYNTDRGYGEQVQAYKIFQGKVA